MKKRFILFMSALIFYNLAAQNPVIYECHQQIETKSKALKSRYVYCSSNDIYTVETSNDPYIPSSNSPIYTVRLNLHVMQEDDGSGNFQDNPADRAFLLQLVDAVNTRYSTNQRPIWNGPRNDPHIPDSRIRFKVDGIYFHQNSAVCHLKPYNESSASSTYFTQYGVNIERSINVFFSELLTGNETPYTSISGNGFGLNGESRNCVGLYSYFYHYSNNTGAFNVLAFNFAHELGHALGLIHTTEKAKDSQGNIIYIDDELSDTYYPDVRGWCNCNSDVNCSNNTMGGSSTQDHFSPRQIGKMRRLMSVGWRAKVVDNCYQAASTTVVSENKTWNRPHLFNSDVVINDGATVTALCKLYLPKHAEIIVHEGSTLILNGSSVFNSCNEDFVFIRVEKGGALEIIGETLLNHCKIIIEDNGTLKLIGNLTLKNNSSIEILSGGYLCFNQQAFLNMLDSNTSLILQYGYNLGVSPFYPLSPSSSNCSPSIDLLQHSGSGMIKDFTTDIYIQNRNIVNNQHIIGKNIYIGRDVTSDLPQGNVAISNNAQVIFEASGKVYFKSGFTCQPGSSFKVIQKD